MSQAALAPPSEEEDTADDRPALDLIELFFFAYRDFIGDPDRILSDYGFGRAHHRVLHFVARHPGLTIADLLDILRITKQSLNRVLKELIGKGFVEQLPGTSDRRQRLLYATPIGRALTRRLAETQMRRIARALGNEAPDQVERTASGFLLGMIDPEDRARVRGLISAAKVPE